MNDTIKEFCSVCREYRDAEVVERDADGWPVRMRWAESVEYDRQHAMATNLAGLLHHAGAAMTIGLDVGDWQLANENADRVLRLNDPRPEEQT